MPGGWNVTFWWGIDEELAGLTHGFNLCHTCSDRMWRICSAFHMSQNCTFQNRTGWIGLNRAELTWVPHGSTDFDGSTWNLGGASAHCITVTAVAKAFQLDQRRPRLWAEWKLPVRCHNCADCSMAWFTVRNYVDTITHAHTFHSIMMYYENVM